MLMSRYSCLQVYFAGEWFVMRIEYDHVLEIYVPCFWRRKWGMMVRINLMNPLPVVSSHPRLILFVIGAHTVCHIYGVSF